MKYTITLLSTLLLTPLAALHAGEPAPAGPMILPAMVDVLTETWRAAEITFESANTYTNPLITAELNVLFTSPSGKQVVVPGFWDGGRTWRVRFAPSEYGVWKYVSTCSDKDVLRPPTDVDAFPKGASPFGVMDLVGNVWQWTDEYLDEHSRGGILRGGSYFKPQGSNWYFPNKIELNTHGKLLLMAPSKDRAATLGFRCVVDAAQ